MKKIGIGVISLMCVLLLAGCGKEEGKNFIVTFNTDGGSKISSVEVKENGKIDSPEKPTKEGYTFDGWYIDDVKYDFNNSITDNITLKAKWVKNGSGDGKTYSISLDLDGGEGTATYEVTVGKKLGKLPTPKKDGYTFAGWYDGNKKVNENTLATADMKLVAKWTKDSTAVVKPSDNTTNATKKVTVAFNSNGGNAVASQTLTSGSVAKKPADPKKSGYTFAGWTLNGKSFNFTTKVTSNITLVASWTKNSTPVQPSEPDDPKDPVVKEYTVTFKDGNTTLSTVKVKENGKVSKPADPSKSGYTFAGWDFDFNTAITKDTVINAKWEAVKADVYTYTVGGPVETASPFKRVSIFKNGTAIAPSANTFVAKNGGKIVTFDSSHNTFVINTNHTSLLAGAELVINGVKVGTLK